MTRNIRHMYIRMLVLILPFVLLQAGAIQAQSLIAYYPTSNSMNLTGEVDAVTYASGNTLSMVRTIRKYTDADLFEIELSTPYSSSYNTVLREAKDDQKIQARPELKRHVQDIGRYDTVFLGYPNWWASIPMPIASFLEDHDLSGKTIIPFCTHGGGRFGQSVSAIGKLAPTSVIGEPLAVSYGGGASLDRDIRRWLEDNGVSLP